MLHGTLTPTDSVTGRKSYATNHFLNSILLTLKNGIFFKTHKTYFNLYCLKHRPRNQVAGKVVRVKCSGTKKKCPTHIRFGV